MNKRGHISLGDTPQKPKSKLRRQTAASNETTNKNLFSQFEKAAAGDPATTPSPKTKKVKTKRVRTRFHISINKLSN